MIVAVREGKKHPALVVLAAVTAVVFFGSLVLLREGRLFLSPDETANAFFAETFARTGTLFSFEPLNAALGDALHPRSVVSTAGRLLPVSFAGLPVIYGSIAAVFGEGIIPFLTPLTAAAAVFAWYAVVRRLFGREIAFISAVLLAIHPAWWYYTSRSLMHNVPFTAALIFTAFFLIVRPLRSLSARPRLAFLSHSDLLFAGWSFGTALFFRTSEAVWAALALALAGFLFRKTVVLRPVLVFALASFLAFSPVLFVNRELYGSPFTFGYTVREEADHAVAPQAETIPPASQDVPALRSSIESFLRPVFPFGIHPRAALRHVNAYGFAFVSAWLGILYGSWTFHDNPDPNMVTIGNSYVRYWLPAFAMATPMAAFAVDWLSRRAMTAWARHAAVAVLLIACAGLSIRTVFFTPQDGLVDAAAVLDRSAEIRGRVLELTKPESVIIVDRADKLFFPHRRVLYPLREERTYALMPRIARRVPLYYYGVTFPPQDIEYLNTRKLKEGGLQIELVETFDEESLYRIYQP